jgi:hypothetical protein
MYKKFTRILFFEISISAQPSCETNNVNRKFKPNDVTSCDNVQAENENMDEFFEFVEKWRTNRLANNKKIEDIFRNSSCE